MADAPEHYTPPVGHSTLEPVHNNQSAHGYYGDGKETVTPADDSLVELKTSKESRICGLPKKTAIIIGAAILLLVIAGAITGGVVGSRKAISSNPAPAASDTASNATSTSSPTATFSSGAASSSAPPIVVPQAEIFDSLRFHSISTYYGSTNSITRNTTTAAQDARDFVGLIGSFPEGGTVGSVGVIKFEPQYDDQIWHIMPAKSAQVPNATLYASYGKQLSLLLITNQRYGQTVRLALDGTAPNAILTLAKQDDEAANQFWSVEQIEADIEGEYGRYALHNYEAGDDWHLGVGAAAEFGKVKAPLMKGRPVSDLELWQIMPRNVLTGEERTRWGTVV